MMDRLIKLADIAYDSGNIELFENYIMGRPPNRDDHRKKD